MLFRGRIIFVYFTAIVLLILVFGWSSQPQEWRSEVLSNLKNNYLPGQSSKDPLPSSALEDVSDEDWFTSPADGKVGEEHDSSSGLTLEETADTSKAEDIGVSTPVTSKEQWNASAYTVVQSSKLSADKKWFKIIFGEQGSYNPNLLPHPWKENTWYMIAQAAQWPGDTKAALYSKENICDATFKDGHMQCIRPQTSLPIASTISEHCQEDRAWFSKMIGPTDARVFYGPDAPYIMYGSASGYTCYGLYLHDLRRLAQWNQFVYPEDRFFWPTELRRPAPFGPVEKNWFAFWSNEGDMYLHHDLEPRVFSKVSKDGKSVSENLALTKDNACIKSKLPVLLDEEESIHQATNSLAVTMCKRQDPTCVESSDNTFVISIFHHKNPHAHNIYQPYVMMFNRTAPFEMHGISAKPIWLNGREKPEDPHPDRPDNQGEMMYITSMQWKEQNMTYHGYMDDDIWINFGIDDSVAGTIDVTVGDLLREMSPCE